MRVSASIRNRRAGKIVFPRAVYSRLQLTHTGRQTSCKHGQLTALKRSSNPTWLSSGGSLWLFREGGHAADAESEQTQHSRTETGSHHQEARWAGELSLTEKEEKKKRWDVSLLFRGVWWILSCVSFAAGGAPERSEAAEGSAEEAAPGDEGEGPAAERAQPGRAGSQQTGGTLPRAAAAQQDLKGTSSSRSALFSVPQRKCVIESEPLKKAICRCLLVGAGCCNHMLRLSAGTRDQTLCQSSWSDLKPPHTHTQVMVWSQESRKSLNAAHQHDYWDNVKKNVYIYHNLIMEQFWFEYFTLRLTYDLTLKVMFPLKRGSGSFEMK